nr:hypothetical protein [Tanacetum cinerariifolium]
SNLHHVLPSPYNTIIHHLSSGDGSDGGGIRWTPFSGGGGGGGRRRRVTNNSQFWVFLGLGLGFVCCLGFLGFKDEVVVLGGLCLTMLLVIVKSGFVPDWLLGFCGGGVVVGVLLSKKDEVRKMVDSGVKTIEIGMGRRRQRGDEAVGLIDQSRYLWIRRLNGATRWVVYVFTSTFIRIQDGED